MECFGIFDYEHSGKISEVEVRHILQSLGESLSDDEMGVVLEGLVDKKGMVEYEELIRRMMDLDDANY